MGTNDATNPEAGVETEASAAAASDEENPTNGATDSESDETEHEAGDEGEDQGEPEEVEIDFAGRKERFRLDGSVKDVVDRVQEVVKNFQGDYTRKTQEIAETAKSLKVREEAVQKLSTINGEALNEYSKALGIKAEIAKLEQVNVQALWATNPDQARQVSDRLSALRSVFQASVERVGHLETQAQQAEEVEASRRIAENKALLEKRTPGFEKMVPEIVEYVASTYGIPKEHAAKVWALDPATSDMARKAMLYDRMQKASKTNPAPGKTASPVPTMKTKGAAQATKDPDKMSVEEWTKWRESQLKKRA